jgi:hypothetical protein
MKPYKQRAALAKCAPLRSLLARSTAMSCGTMTMSMVRQRLLGYESNVEIATAPFTWGGL